MMKTQTDSPIVEQSPQTNGVLYFGSYHLDLQNEQLWHEQQTVRLTGKSFAVLRYLVEHSNQLVTKRELFRAVWTSTIVSHSTLTSCIKELRKALADDARSPQYIETVHRRGYRFIAPLSSVPPQGPESRVQGPESERHGGVLLVQTPDPRRQALDVSLVGRDAELAQLHQWFARACRGERQVIFVSGEAGIGKTALVEAFLQRLETEGWRLVPSPQASSLKPLASPVWLAHGQCVEQYGAGEPYLPVLTALGRLCRGVEGDAVKGLLHRHAPTWLVHMPALLSDEERETLQRQVGGATRDRMLREMAEALEALTVERPFILCLEDLHWSDYSTLELLSVVTSRPEPARLFVLGTCRPLEVLGGDHPLKNLRIQIQRSDQYHDFTPCFLSAEAVGQYLARRFADRALPAGVEQVVHHHAEGNPLFMVNVADYLEQQGVFDDESGDQVQQILDGATIGIPESLRQLIEHHIEKMSADEQDVLMAASVAGMEFSAATVAAGLREEDEAVEVRCANLARRSQFFRDIGVAEWPDGTFVSRYRFIHAFYQNVLYERVPLGRRVSLHLRIGERLERAYPSRRDEVASELAVHFEHGRDFRRAVQYIGQAAQSAMWTYAYREAIDHLRKGVKLLTQLPESPEREQQELALQVGLSLSLMHTRGFAAPEVEHAYDRIRDLCQTAGDSLQRFAALWGLRNFHLLRGEPQAGRAAAQEFLEQVQRTQISSLAAEAHLGLGTPLFQLGEFEAARPHLEQSLRLYNPQLPQPKVLLTGQDPRASSLAHLAVLLWITGYPDQAREHSRQALTLAQDTMFPYGRALTSNLAATLHVCCRDFQAVAQHAETAKRFAQECGYVHLMAMGMVLQGWALAMQGKSDEGITLMKTGLQRQQAAGVRIGEVSYRLLLADAYSKIGQDESALQALTDAVAAVERTEERTFEPELYRLQGELALQQSRANLGQVSNKFQASLKQSRTSLGEVKASQDKSEDTDRRRKAEACFLKAIDIARRQQAKSLELRTTLSLARLWQQQGRQHAAHSMLSEVYSWFSEGFDTPDLQEAKILLEELQRVG